MSLIGQNIRKIRSVKSLSQQGFADLFKITRASVGAYEEGRAEPKTDTSILIARYFKLTLDQLITKEISVNNILNPGFDSLVEGHIKTTRSFHLLTIENAFQSFEESFVNCKDIELSKDLFSGNAVIEYRDSINNQSNTNLFSKDWIVGQRVQKVQEGDLMLAISEKGITLSRSIDKIKADTFYIKVTSIIKKNLQEHHHSHLEQTVEDIQARLIQLEKVAFKK
ncbi:helix-turn-helix domain-containing protein [Flavobacteriales bacterium]|nr:helix-turn-helix domain-containing protein [Flavobacteriales bacterium]